MWIVKGFYSLTIIIALSTMFAALFVPMPFWWLVVASIGVVVFAGEMFLNDTGDHPAHWPFRLVLSIIILLLVVVVWIIRPL